MTTTDELDNALLDLERELSDLTDDDQEDGVESSSLDIIEDRSLFGAIEAEISEALFLDPEVAAESEEEQKSEKKNGSTKQHVIDVNPDGEAQEGKKQNEEKGEQPKKHEIQSLRESKAKFNAQFNNNLQSELAKLIDSTKTSPAVTPKVKRKRIFNNPFVNGSMAQQEIRQLNKDKRNLLEENSRLHGICKEYKEEIAELKKLLHETQQKCNCYEKDNLIP
mmetsp:Transcript_20743/g.23065  ORF Transcript_20743/g.23065 Transcript_20743/m.23065 type:complete len:222 (-) Transcript_20743:111-776(-)